MEVASTQAALAPRQIRPRRRRPVEEVCTKLTVTSWPERWQGVASFDLYSLRIYRPVTRAPSPAWPGRLCADLAHRAEAGACATFAHISVSDVRQGDSLQIGRAHV